MIKGKFSKSRIGIIVVLTCALIAAISYFQPALLILQIPVFLFIPGWLILDAIYKDMPFFEKIITSILVSIIALVITNIYLGFFNLMLVPFWTSIALIIIFLLRLFIVHKNGH